MYDLPAMWVISLLAVELFSFSRKSLLIGVVSFFYSMAGQLLLFSIFMFIIDFAKSAQSVEAAPRIPEPIILL
jgi:hypothetical protein